MGMVASPKRWMPARSPKASDRAEPRARAVSSTVWWSSISRSPFVVIARSNRAWEARDVSKWSKNPTPVSTFAVPVPSRFKSISTVVSLVVRSTRLVLDISSPVRIGWWRLVRGHRVPRHWRGW